MARDCPGVGILLVFGELTSCFCILSLLVQETFGTLRVSIEPGFRILLG